MQITGSEACVPEKRSCKCEGEICNWTSNQAWAQIWVCACACHHPPKISSRQLLVSVCNGRASGSAIRGTPREACVFVHTKDQGWASGCVLSSLSRRQLLVCVCITAERLWLHKAVVLLLIMKYIVLNSHTTTPCNILNNTHKENNSQDTLTNCVSSSKG